MVPIFRPSPNFGPRRHGRDPDMVVLHHTAMRSAAAAVTRLCDPASKVSAHYVLSEVGQLYCLVPENLRAWHAGQGRWGDTDDINSHSIGIELANAGPQLDFPPFPEPQMHALEVLLKETLGRWHIPARNVIAHSDMAPTRKFDPGAKFDWQRLARQGLSVWASPQQDGDFLTNAAKFGYRAPRDCKDPIAVILAAFRLRFRPGATGPLTPTDQRLICALAAKYPVDRPDRDA